MARRLVTGLLALGFAGCTAVGTDDAGSSEAAQSETRTKTWSKDTFSLAKTEPGAFDVGDAYWMARLASIGYQSHDEILAGLTDMGISNAEIASFDDPTTGTQAVYLGIGEAGFVGFRGTENDATDLATDLDIRQTSTLFGAVHTGFHRAFRALWDGSSSLRIAGAAKPGDGLRTLLGRRHGGTRGRPLYFSGHSLGGALATIAFVFARYEGCSRAYADLSEPLASDAAYAACAGGRRLPVHAVYTFGAPRIGDARFARLAAGDGIWDAAHPYVHRFVHGLDAVPRLLAFPAGFWHPQRAEEEGATLLFLPDTGKLRRGGELPSMWTTDVFRPMRDHALDAYLARVLAQVEPGKTVRVPDHQPPAAAVVNEYLAAGPDAFTPIGPEALGGLARRDFDGWAPEGATAYLVETARHRIYEVRRTKASETRPEGMKESRLYDETFLPIVAIAEIEDPAAPNGVGTVVLPVDAPR